MILNTEFSSMHLYYIMNTGLIVNLTEHSMFIIMTSLESAWSPRAPGGFLTESKDMQCRLYPRFPGIGSRLHGKRTDG